MVDREKLRAVILHTCQACKADMLGAVKLNKVLYFLDMISFAKSGKSVTGSTYVKRPFGPTCLQILPAIRDMEKEGFLRVSDVDYFGLQKKEYVALANPPADVLSNEEVSLLHEVVDFVCKRNSAKSISEFSHKLPWEMAEFGKEIPYRSALLLFPTQTSLQAFDAVAEDVAKIEDSRSNEDTVDYPVFADFRARVLQTGAST